MYPGQSSPFSRAQTLRFPHQSPMQVNVQPTSQCDICGKSYNLEHNIPKKLPCGHSFCLFCLTLQEN